MPIPKSLENRIRAVISQVHQRRLADSLAPVEEAIRRWRAGEGSIFEIEDAIHKHQMRSRRFWNLYANTAATSPQVIYVLNEALDLGLLTREQYQELTRVRRK
ncbi:MAG: hypothetical protein ACRD2M_10960 [Terriglobales bacterium]